MGEQAERLELGELVAHRRRGDVDACPLDERFRPDGLAGRDVLLDHAPQDLALAGGELFHGRPSYRGRPRRGGARRRSPLSSVGASRARAEVSRRRAQATRRSGAERNPQASSSAVTAPPRNRPRGVSASVTSPPAPRARPRARLAAYARAQPGRSRPRAPRRQRLVQPEAEHDALQRLRQGVELLELARRSVAGRQRADVAPDGGAFRRRAAPSVETAPTPMPR